MEMSEDALYVLIAADLAGEITPAQARQLLAWRTQKPAHEALYAHMRAIYFNHRFEGSAAWPRVAARLDAPTTSPKLSADKRGGGAVPSGAAPRPGYPAGERSFPIWAWAATILLLLAFALSPLVNRWVATADAWVEKSVPKGEKLQFTLPDGSLVWLNADSRLRYMASFDDSLREVFLEGEAFFDVVPNAAQPFVIRTKHSEVRVLGTSFNVRAYPDMPQTETLVVTGEVRVTDRQNTARTMLLRPREKGTLEHGTGKTAQRAVEEPLEMAASSAWPQGTLVLYDEPLPVVAQRLSRWYGVTIELDSATLAQCRLTARFENESLEQVLDYVSIVMPIRYERQGERFVVTGERCAP